MANKLVLTSSELQKLHKNRSRSINLSRRRHNSRRNNRNRGLPYVSKNGTQILAKEEPEELTCGCTREGCRMSIEEKRKAFQYYCSTISYEEKTVYLATLMERSDVLLGGHGSYRCF